MARSTLWMMTMLAACAGSKKADTAAGVAAQTPTADEALAAAITSALDPSVDACDDFYAFSCGGWIESAELPPDKTRYTRSFTTIFDSNEAFLRDILETAAAGPQTDPEMAHVGNVYGACMDAAAVDAAGAAPLDRVFQQVERVSDLVTLSRAWGALGTIGVSTPLAAGVFADLKDPDLNILHMGQGGLGLPDRDYYINLDADGQALLGAYEQHIAKMFVLSGVDADQAAKDAKDVVAFETALARVHRPRHELRDPEQNYNRLDRAGTKALFTHIDIDAMFEGLGQDIQAISVGRPDVYEATDALVGHSDLPTLKKALRWNVIRAFASSMSTAFVEENFAFYGQRLRGQAALRPRWKRCVGLTQSHLGDVMSKQYVAQRFAGESKAKAETMILDIEHAFEDALSDLEWMDDVTRERAVEKVGTLKNKIGYPAKWKSFERLETTANSHFDNVAALRSFTASVELEKVGGPVDKDEWFMSASDVNAYYNPLNNEMAFPAGILQPPFFSADYPTAMNYGAIGMVMGHELTHGFDDSGRKFAPNGQLVEWWEEDVAERFEERAACVESQYSGFEVQPGLHLNGKLTLGENIADLGGIKQALHAYRAWELRESAQESVAGFTGEQLLFVSFAQGWCTLMTPEAERERVATDSHSTAKWRVNGPLMNLPEFGEAFGCEEGSPMRPKRDDICEVW